MSGKVCKAGHGFAAYLTECPFCVPAKGKAVQPRPVTVSHCPTCSCGAKRVYKSAAARQRAYRQRKGAT